MNKKLLSAALLAMVMVVGAGCGQKPTAAPASQETAQNQNEQSDVNAAQPDDSNGSDASQGDDANNTNNQVDKPDQKADEPADQKQMIEVYYTDPQEMELKKSEKEIHFKKDSDKYQEAFKALQDSGNSELIPLWGKMELKSMEVKDGAMTLDIHMPDEARLGAGGEQFALDALSQTMFQFKEVQTIELLVDGQQVESLMGHVDLNHPMNRN
ncbi:GerMN domain-containing protein [Paenibacillus dokdonensis]|uniref:GerMN domain-containing protein n=1 Tax=Paenibacillus dokdonensis TaxID=2567944 RepID=A0ABU6GVH3_9BACL|nr:GerMN domain-containing protein [Paenibacillus dokdonensis]MEC0243218.1 GerMN domain-containing protein [Paenibacillus dokdonensis]